MYLLRKITLGKWAKAFENSDLKSDEIDADTVMYEFKTDSNKLSVWVVENDTDLEDAFIALASNMDSIGTINAIKIDVSDLKGLTLDNELGNTPTIDINQKHRNIINLTYGGIGIVINAILKSIREQLLVRKTKGDMKKLLIKAHESGKLDVQKVSEKILKSIGISEL